MIAVHQTWREKLGSERILIVAQPVNQEGRWVVRHLDSGRESILPEAVILDDYLLDEDEYDD